MSRRMGETSYKETAFGIIPRSQLIPLEIEGVSRAWNFVLSTVDIKTDLSSALLKRIHRIGFGWIFPEMGGKFRTIDVEVSDHKPPVFFLVPQLMKDFCDDWHERMKHLPPIRRDVFFPALVELLAWAHHRFLWIHPFQDYNGRMARLITNVILLKLNLPPIELNVETRKGRTRYIRALQNADHGDLKALQKLIEEALVEAAKELNNLS